MADEQSGEEKGKLTVIEEFRPRPVPQGPSREQEYLKVLPIVRRFEREIAAFCNARFKDGAVKSTTVASELFRKMLIATAAQVFDRGDVNGRKYIETVIDAFKNDAIKDWTSG